MATSVEGGGPSPALSPAGIATARAATTAVRAARRNASALRVGDTSDKPPALVDHIHKDVAGWSVDEDALERIGRQGLDQSGWPLLLSCANKLGSGVIGELPTVAAFVDQPERSAFRAVDSNAEPCGLAGMRDAEGGQEEYCDYGLSHGAPFRQGLRHDFLPTGGALLYTMTA